MVPVETSVKATISGLPPLVGSALNAATGGVISPQQVRRLKERVSRYQPPAPVLLSLAQRQRNCTCFPCAATGISTVVDTNPPELPLQAARPPKGFPNWLLRICE